MPLKLQVSIVNNDDRSLIVVRHCELLNESKRVGN